VVVSRFLTVPVVLRLLRYDNRVGLIGAIHLSQISEFALVIMLVGVSDRYRHISTEIVSIVVMVLVATATLSTYLVLFSHGIVRGIVRGLGGTVLGDPQAEVVGRDAAAAAPIVLVGLFRTGSSLVRGLLDSGRAFRVIDFNPRAHRELQRLGVPCIYGDISHLDTLEHAGVEHAEMLISSIPDDFLRGTSNRALMTTLRRLNPTARIVVTAGSAGEALEFYREGADHVLVPSIVAADRLLGVLDDVDAGGLDALREREIAALEGRRDVEL